MCSHDPTPRCRRCQLAGVVPFPEDMPPPPEWEPPNPKVVTTRRLRSSPLCLFLGEEATALRPCPTCKGTVRLKEFACAAGLGAGGRAVPTVDCVGCKGYTPMTHWAYGVTTVPSRRKTLLPQTLESLAKGGFDSPRLFVDGDADGRDWEREFGLPVTARGGDPVRTAGNWALSLLELYYRDPSAERFALFQDDFVTCRGLRKYLSRVRIPQDGYFNLYTFPSNQEVAPGALPGEKEGVGVDASNPGPRGEPCGVMNGQRVGWFRARACNGDRPTQQTGRGAVALVFTRPALFALLGQPYLYERAQDLSRGYCKVDGAVVTALNRAGWWEYCHHPSLVQHTGDVSSMGNMPHRKAISFPGEDYDATALLGG